MKQKKFSPRLVFVAVLPQRVTARSFTSGLEARGSDLAALLSCAVAAGKEEGIFGRWHVTVEFHGPRSYSTQHKSLVGIVRLGWIETTYTKGEHLVHRVELKPAPVCWVEEETLPNGEVIGRMVFD
jgi:hypothetical protein